MAEFRNRWRALCPTIRALCVFLLLNGVGLNLLLAALPWTPGRKTVFNYTARTVMANGGTDSWGQMATALAEFRARPEGELYHHVFLRRHIRFPYPPTSLLLTDATEHLGLGFAFLNLVSAMAVLRPHYGFLLLWAASRRRWTFCISFGGTILLTVLASLWVFGLANHLDYLWMLSHVSRHGESYFANNAVNGFLHRLLFNGENLEWHEDRYTPMNEWVVGGTLVASATLVALCLVWRRREADAGGIVDLMSAVLTCVMASPVAWEHHYGILLPIYAVLLPKVLRPPRAPVVWLAVSYVLTSNYFGVTTLAAGTWLNFVQSSLLFGAALVLVCLFRSLSWQALGSS